LEQNVDSWLEILGIFIDFLFLFEKNMKRNYEKLFKVMKDYIRINSEKMKIDFDLFSSKLGLKNIAFFAQNLDEKSAKDFLVMNLKNHKELKNQKRLVAQADAGGAHKKKMK
jgi:hypothetical protein